MNIKRALNVIDQVAIRNRANSYSTKLENEMRLKVSDLRAVVEALGEDELPSDFDYSRTDLEGVLQMIETGHMSVACASHYIKNIFEIIDAIKARTKSPNANQQVT